MGGVSVSSIDQMSTKFSNKPGSGKTFLFILSIIGFTTKSLRFMRGTVMSLGGARLENYIFH
jgi:hypothetical protein